MSALANSSISRKVMVAFAAVIAVMLVSSAIAYDRLRVIEEAKKWRVHTLDVLETLQAAWDAMLDQETGVRGYFITGNETSLEAYSRGTDVFAPTIRKLKELTADNPAQQRRIDELTELANGWHSEIGERMIALMVSRETREDARALEGSLAGKRTMDRIRAKVDEIAGVERDLLAKRSATQNQAFATAYMISILGGAASLVIAIVMGIVLTRGIVAPITRVTGTMTALAKGDTGVEVPDIGRGDEIGAMAAAIQVFKQSIIERQRVQAELAKREAKIRRLVDANIIGIFIWDAEGHTLDANDAFLQTLGYDRNDLAADRIRWKELTPLEWHERSARTVGELESDGVVHPYEKEFFRKDGSRVPVLLGAATFEPGGNQGVAFVLDLTERKRAEEALRASEERFRTLVQFSFDVYWESDAQHRFTRQEFAEGLADAPVPGSEIGKTRWEVPYLEPEEEAWRKHRETLDAHLPFRDFELARPAPDGGKRYVSVSGLPVFDKAGYFMGYRGVGRHTTERKRIEEALHQREKELREILETIPAMTVTVLPPDGSNVFIGKRFAEYSGLSPEDAQGSGWKAAAHPDDVDLHVRQWRASLASGEPIEIETRFRRAADGEYRWFLARAAPLRDDQGNILKWYEVLTDIEDRKRVEAALRESEEQWKAVFENPFGAEQLGYRVDELIGRPVHILFHDADRERALRNKAFCLDHLGQALSWELRKLRKDGEARWVRETARAMLINNRPVILVVSEDISEGRRAAEALREVQAELAHANRVAALGQLTASIAHEVNQPLTGMLNSGRAALHWLDRPDQEAARRAIERVVRDATRAGDVIKGLRSLVKKTRPRTESFDMNEAIREVIVVTRGEAAKSGISVKTQLAEGLPLIHGDRVSCSKLS